MKTPKNTVLDSKPLFMYRKKPAIRSKKDNNGRRNLRIWFYAFSFVIVFFKHIKTKVSAKKLESNEKLIDLCQNYMEVLLFLLFSILL